MLPETKSLEFGEFLLDVKEKVLLRDGERLPINPKTYQLLVTLIENHGHLVEKEQLMQTLWADSFVEDANLAFTVSLLRKTLGDDAGNPRFIDTVPKRGYRFVAEVRPASNRTAHLILLDKPSPENLDPRSRKETGGGTAATAVLNAAPAAAPVVTLEEWRKERRESDERAADASAERNEIDVSKPKLFLAAPTDQKKSTSNFLLKAGLISVGVGFGLGLYYLLGRGVSSNPIPMVNLTRMTSNGKTKVAAISPNGEFISYVLDDEGQQSLWLKNVATDSDTKILAAAEDVSLHNPIFTPDGNYIYYGSKETLYQVPLLGGLSKKIVLNLGVRPDLSAISFSPDKKRFAFVRHLSASASQIVVSGSDDGSEQIIASSERPEHFLRSAAWSPDGQVIAVVMQTSDGRNKIAAASVADGAISAIPAPSWSLVSHIAWLPNGNSLLVVGTERRSSITHQIFTLSYPSGEPKNISNDLNNYQSVSVTADGRALLAVRTEQTSHIWVMSSEEKSQPRQLTHGIDKYDGIQGLSFSSGGKITYESMAGDKGEIWRVDAEGRNAEQLVDESGSTLASPSGRYLVFQSRDAEGVGLFIVDLTTGERRRLTKGTDIWPVFSPDEKWVVFTRWAEQVALWKVTIDGGEAIKLTNVSGYPLAPTISPDGKFIAFYWQKGDRKTPAEIAVLPFEGGDVGSRFELPIQHWLGHGKNVLQWTPDGKAISYAVLRTNVSNIWRQPIDGSPAFQVTDFTEDRIFNFAYSPDGLKLALARGTFNRDAVLIKAP